jgi:hypothetical protein
VHHTVSQLRCSHEHASWSCFFLDDAFWWHGLRDGHYSPGNTVRLRVQFLTPGITMNVKSIIDCLRAKLRRIPLRRKGEWWYSSTHSFCRLRINVSGNRRTLSALRTPGRRTVVTHCIGAGPQSVSCGGREDSAAPTLPDDQTVIIHPVTSNSTDWAAVCNKCRWI